MGNTHGHPRGEPERATFLAMSRSRVPRGISIGFHHAGMGICATCCEHAGSSTRAFSIAETHAQFPAACGDPRAQGVGGPPHSLRGYRQCACRGFDAASRAGRSPLLLKPPAVSPAHHADSAVSRSSPGCPVPTQTRRMGQASRTSSTMSLQGTAATWRASASTRCMAVRCSGLLVDPSASEL